MRLSLLVILIRRCSFAGLRFGHAVPPAFGSALKMKSPSMFSLNAIAYWNGTTVNQVAKAGTCCTMYTVGMLYAVCFSSNLLALRISDVNYFRFQRSEVLWPMSTTSVKSWQSSSCRWGRFSWVSIMARHESWDSSTNTFVYLALGWQHESFVVISIQVQLFLLWACRLMFQALRGHHTGRWSCK